MGHTRLGLGVVVGATLLLSGIVTPASATTPLKHRYIATYPARCNVNDVAVDPRLPDRTFANCGDTRIHYLDTVTGPVRAIDSPYFGDPSSFGHNALGTYVLASRCLVSNAGTCEGDLHDLVLGKRSVNGKWAAPRRLGIGYGGILVVSNRGWWVIWSGPDGTHQARTIDSDGHTESASLPPGSSIQDAVTTNDGLAAAWKDDRGVLWVGWASMVTGMWTSAAIGHTTGYSEPTIAVDGPFTYVAYEDQGVPKLLRSSRPANADFRPVTLPSNLSGDGQVHVAAGAGEVWLAWDRPVDSFEFGCMDGCGEASFDVAQLLKVSTGQSMDLSNYEAFGLGASWVKALHSRGGAARATFLGPHGVQSVEVT